MQCTVLGLWLLIIPAFVDSAPLTEREQPAIVSASFGRNEQSLQDENRGHRQKRQLSTFVWTPSDFLQSLGKTLSSAASRIQGVFSNSVVTDPDSPIVRMVTDFRERVAPVILRTIYTGAIQQGWEQILKRARASANQFFDWAAADT